MTEDVLEQVVDDWLRRRGYFTRTNVRFGPAKDDAGYMARLHNQMSDLDVLAVSPRLKRNDPAAVYAVSCKAMQEGFSPNGWLAAAASGRRYKGRGKGAAWKHLRELWDPVWAASLRNRVQELTGATRFTYVLAVTRLGRGGSDDMTVLTAHPQIKPNLAGNPCELWTFGHMWNELSLDVREQIEPSHVGRLAQLLKAAQNDAENG
jgi:hypothetical protein